MIHRPFTLVVSYIFCSVLSFAYADSVYRWIDKSGHVHYSDFPPEENVRQIQEKRITQSMIQTSGASYAMQIATQKYPATFYTSGDCGKVCEQAKALLDKRGIQYAVVDANTQSSKLIKITGNAKVPVLTLGSTTVVRGWEEERWNNALDEAGYPKNFIRGHFTPPSSDNSPTSPPPGSPPPADANASRPMPNFAKPALH